jgi:hypothetical protein
VRLSAALQKNGHPLADDHHIFLLGADIHLSPADVSLYRAKSAIPLRIANRETLIDQLRLFAEVLLERFAGQLSLDCCYASDLFAMENTSCATLMI